MKILIAYDGSECSDAAIVDLRRAGLPARAEALVLSVAEVWPQPATVPYNALVVGPGNYDSGVESDIWNGPLQEAEAFVILAAERLRADFPCWDIYTEAWVEAPGSSIIRKAHAWKPDLIVVGSHGRSGIRRALLGSVSQHILNHVTCSVRISRHRLHSQERGIRVLIGVDGSHNAKMAVRSVAERNWPTGTEARVVGVLDSRIALSAATTLEGALPAVMEDESRNRMSEAVHEAAHELAKSGLNTTHQMLAGVPSEVLLAEAEKWASDCVFVGATELNRFERFLLGNVSSTLSASAHCSVEIVRAPLE